MNAAGRANVERGIEQDRHLGVQTGVAGAYVQLSGARRNGPVDVAQPVAGAEQSDIGELGAVTWSGAPVASDQPDRAGHRSVHLERGRCGQHTN